MHLTKYLKKYTPMILLAITLLFIQANADLALPDYFSNIVNTGIQQGGIEDSVPSVIRQSQLEHSLLFTDDENKSKILEHYELLTNTSDNADKLMKKYPLLENESLYQLKSINSTERAELNRIIAPIILVTYMLDQFIKNPDAFNQTGGNFALNLSQIPPNMDLYTFLNFIPLTNRTDIRDSLTSQLSVLGENMLTQAGIRAVLDEYKIIGIDTAKIQTDYVIKVGSIMILLTLLSITCSITVGYLAAKTATGFAKDVRSETFKKVENFSNAEFDRFSTASLITRSTNDINQIQMVIIMVIRLVFYAPIMGFGGIIHALEKSANMWWIIGLAVVILLTVIAFVFSLAVPKFKLIQKLIDRLNLVAREQLQGIMVIRAFNRQDVEREKFDKANMAVTKTSLFLNRLMTIMMPFMMLVMNGLSVLIIWVGGHQIADANIQLGDMMAFMQYSMQIVMAFLMMSIMFVLLPRALVSADRIAEVLDVEPSIRDKEETLDFPEPFKGEIRFNNVSFKYPSGEVNALTNVDFTANPGKVTAIIGPTGAGKTTILNLITRFYDVTEGSVEIDGIDIRNVKQSALREKIGYVPQKSVLFSGTILSNLYFANENASKEQIVNSLQIAQAEDFVTSNPLKVNMPIAQGGMNVSGGQKQRLSIARALVKEPPIYLFDDSFSSLDFRTESALRQALKEWASDSTVIIVTQRIAPIMDADQILVIDDGVIVGKGTHKELMKNNKIYREIAQTQLNLEEN